MLSQGMELSHLKMHNDTNGIREGTNPSPTVSQKIFRFMDEH